MSEWQPCECEACDCTNFAALDEEGEPICDDCAEFNHPGLLYETGEYANDD